MPISLTRLWPARVLPAAGHAWSSEMAALRCPEGATGPCCSHKGRAFLVLLAPALDVASATLC